MRRAGSVVEQIRQAAEEDARRLGHSWLGVEHLFLAILRIEGGLTAEVLEGLGHRASELRHRLREHVGAGRVTGRELAVTPRAGRVIEAAGMLAEQQGVAPGELHLALAIIQDGANAAVRVLAAEGVDIERFGEELQRAWVRRQRGRGAGTGQEEGPVLERGRDLTALGRQGELHEVIGRGQEMLDLARTLVRKDKNNPVLIGEAGVGKTAVVEGLAYRIARGDVQPQLRGKRIIELSPAQLVAGTTLRGQFEERMQRLIEELRAQPDVIVFFDEIHTLLGAGAGQQSPLDAAQILKPVLARGEICCIGATTIEEYRRYIEADAALERRFQPIMVEEPSGEVTLQILQALRERYEGHHGVRIEDEALEAAVRLTGRFVPERRYPDKALDALDQACAMVQLGRLSFDGGEEAQQLARELPRERRPAVGAQEVARVVARWTGRPAEELTGDERERLLRLEDELGAHVIGQQQAIEQVAGAIRAARAGLRGRNRPQAVFLFLGPTGVGKTELTRELARVLFGSREAMIRLDMSEYMERHNVARLVGAPPGYVGHEEEGQLTGALRTHPHSVVLLDEVEKAHPDVFDVFLQVFDDGRLTDGKGRTVDCRDAIFIMTSNIGSEQLEIFQRDDSTASPVDEENLRELLLQHFRPEFLNRIDEIVVFRPLGSAHMQQIARLMLREVEQNVAEEGLRLHVTETALEALAQAGWDPQFGARPLRRAIERLLVRPLSDLILAGRFQRGSLVIVTAGEAGLVFENAGSYQEQPGEADEGL